MRYKTGDLFTNTTKTIGHGVNCSGVMGAGIAKPIREKYPNNFSNYRAACRRGFLTPGSSLFVVEDGVNIFNMASQDKPGRHARYDWLFGSALDAATQAVEAGLDTIAIPMIGCGIGGLKWWHVATLLSSVEEIVNDTVPGEAFEWEVWQQ